MASVKKAVKKKLSFKGVASIGRNLTVAAENFVKVIANKNRQLLVASNGSVIAVNAIPQVRFWDPVKGVSHASVLKKELNLTLASDGKGGDSVRAFTCTCTGCQEVILSETKLNHCILCASEIAPEEYEEVELDVPSNEELDALEEDENLDCEEEDDDCLEEEEEEIEDEEEGDAFEDSEDVEEDDAEFGDDLEEDEDIEVENEEEGDELEEEDDAVEDEELIGDELEEEEEDDLEIGDALEEDEDIEIEDDALEEDEDVEVEDAEEGDALEDEDADEEEVEVGEGDALEDDEDEIAEEDDEEGDALEEEEEVEADEEDEGDFFIDDEGDVNIDLVDGAELEEGDECDVEYSSAMSGNKRWIASVNGMPVAYATQATAGKNKDIFHTEAFGKVSKEVIAKAGLTGLKSLGFTNIVVQAPVKGLIQASVNAEISKAEAGVAKRLEALSSDYQTALGMAAAGINRGFFGDVVNPLKVRMWEELSSLGIPQPHRVIDRVFKETAEDFCRVLIEKASELQAKPAEIRAELSKAIIGANYVAVAEDDEEVDGVEDTEEESFNEEVANKIEASSMPFANRTNNVVESASSVTNTDSFTQSLDSVFKTL